MDEAARDSPADRLTNVPHPGLRWAGVLFALAFPALGTWLYFVLADDFGEQAQKIIYTAFKIAQFAFPLVWTVVALREPLRTKRPTASGQFIGLAFGVFVVAAGMALYEFVLRDHPAFAGAAVKIHDRIADFGINTSTRFFLLTGFYCVVHSLLEEYYWRWFVFRQMRQLMALWPAAILSAIGFTLHHVIVLAGFFAAAPWLAVLLAGAITVGGVFWAWLFDRSDSVFDTWPSHLVIDAGIFLGVGYPLVRYLFNSGG